MTNLEPSMQPMFNENWVVRVGRETFSLNGKEMEIVLDAIRQGTRGIVQLKDRGFSIAHLESYWLEKREPKNQLRLDRPEAIVNDEEKAMADKKLEEIKSKYPFLRKTIA